MRLIYPTIYTAFAWRGLYYDATSTSTTFWEIIMLIMHIHVYNYYFKCLMKRFNKTESPNFVLMCVLCFQRQPVRFLFYFTAAGVSCRVAAVNILLVLHHSVDYTCTFISFGTTEPCLVTLIIETEYRLSRC